MKYFAAAAPCPSYQDEKTLRCAIEKVLAPQIASYGHLSGSRVLLKPNLLAYRKEDDLACVHRKFLLESVRSFLDAGAKVTLMENPAVQSAEAVIRAMGLEEELRRLDVKVASFRNFAKMEGFREELTFHNLEVAREFEDFDAVCDIAKAKTHGMMTLTLCVKNLFGLIRGSDRMAWHLNVGRNFSLFADMLLDIYLTVRPAFNLVDAIVCMEGNGPGSGTETSRNFVFGGNDALCVDSFLAPLLTGGKKELLILENARRRNLLPEYEFISPPVENFAALELPPEPGLLCEWGVFLPPGLKKYLREWVIARPVVEPSKCIGCGLCAKLCPPQSLKIRNGKAWFDYPECIRCFCCQEHCPQGAITIRKSFLMDLFSGSEKLIRKGCSLLTPGKRNSAG